MDAFQEIVRLRREGRVDCPQEGGPPAKPETTFAMELIEESGAESQAEARFTRVPGSIWNLEFEIWSLRIGIFGLRPANLGFPSVSPHHSVLSSSSQLSPFQK